MAYTNKPIKIFDISIRHPCHKCSFISYEQTARHMIWKCALFDVLMKDHNGSPITDIADKEYCNPCGECKILTERFSKLPEINEEE